MTKVIGNEALDMNIDDGSERHEPDALVKTDTVIYARSMLLAGRCKSRFDRRSTALRLEDCGWGLSRHRQDGSWVNPEFTGVSLVEGLGGVWLVAERFEGEPPVEGLVHFSEVIFGVRPTQLACRPVGLRMPVSIDRASPLSISGQRVVCKRVWPRETEKPQLANAAGVRVELRLSLSKKRGGARYYADLHLGGPLYTFECERARRLVYPADNLRACQRVDDVKLTASGACALLDWVTRLAPLGVRPSTERTRYLSQVGRVVRIAGTEALGVVGKVKAPGGPRFFLAVSGARPPQWAELPAGDLGTATAALQKMAG